MEESASSVGNDFPRGWEHQIRRHEVEELCLGETDLHNSLICCQKHPNHNQFVPICDFNIKDLPEGYRDNDIVDLVKAQGDRTVLVIVGHISENRPKFYPDSTDPYPFYDKPGQQKDIQIRGSGWVSRVVKDRNNGNCDCESCRTSGCPDKEWGEIYVKTVAHLIFDADEAKNAKCVFFYDEPDADIDCALTLSGWELLYDSSVNEDRCHMRYVTHDMYLLDKLEKIQNHYGHLHEIVMNKYKDIEHTLTFIVSHPHGCCKQVTVGDWKDRQEMGNNHWTQYLYTTPTCQGSSGAPVYILGKSCQWCDHPHSGGQNDEGLNSSGFGREVYLGSRRIDRFSESLDLALADQTVREDILSNALKLMTHDLGHKVIMRFLAEDQDSGSLLTQKLLHKVEGKLMKMALNKYASQVIQKVFLCITSELQICLAHELENHILTLVRDQHGYRIVTACLRSGNHKCIQLIVKAVQGEVFYLSSHQYGSSVICHLIEFSTKELRKPVLGELMSAKLPELKDLNWNDSVCELQDEGTCAQGSPLPGASLGCTSGVLVGENKINVATHSAQQLSKPYIIYEIMENHTEEQIASVMKELQYQEVFWNRAGLLDVLTQSDRMKLIRILKELCRHILRLAKDQFGCEVVVKILKHCSDEETHLLINELYSHMEGLAKDPNGKHIILHVLKQGNEQAARFWKKLFDCVQDLARDQHGSQVVLDIVWHSEREEVVPLLKRLEEHAEVLAKDPHGSFVIQSILEHQCVEKSAIGKAARRSLKELSRHKDGSNVVKKCLEHCSVEEHAEFVKDICDMDSEKQNEEGYQPELCALMTDKFGHAVIDAIFDKASTAQRKIMMAKIKPHYCTLLHDNYGKKVLAKIQSPRLQEFRKNPEASLSLSDVLADILEFSLDAKGSSVIQRTLEQATETERNLVFEGILPAIDAVLTHEFGHLVVQKLLEAGLPDHKKALVDIISKNFSRLVMDMYGCKVLQTAVMSTQEGSRKELVTKLTGQVLDCVKDKHGHQVVQTCIQHVDFKHMEFILEVVQGQVADLSKHLYGVSVIQYILKHWTDEEVVVELLEKLCADSMNLAQHRNGNNVIQCIFQHCAHECKLRVMENLCDHTESLAKNQYGHQVIQRILENCGQDQTAPVVDQLLPHIEHLAIDQYGNNVIQCLTKHCADYKLPLVLKPLIPQAVALSKDPHGNKVIKSVLEHCSDKHKSLLVKELQADIVLLSQDRYGSEVTLSVMEHGSKEDKALVVSAIKSELLPLSQHEFASKVVQKCLCQGSMQDKDDIISAVCEMDSEQGKQSPFYSMMTNSQSQGVLLKILDVASGEQCKILAQMIRPHLDTLRQDQGGTQFLAYLQVFCTRNVSL